MSNNMEQTGDGVGAEAALASTQPIVLTEKAIEMTKKALAEEGLENHGLRVAVRGGGCSGLEYALDFAESARPGDTILEVSGLKVYIDMASLQYLKGTEIDYVSGLQGSGFKFKNPNAKRSCGCGHSFS
ncbi:MAG: iron-sulfur cluster assembly accessory protein [Bdellovibrionota bacterium]